jgi:hypothetical protein
MSCGILIMELLQLEWEFNVMCHPKGAPVGC